MIICVRACVRVHVRARARALFWALLPWSSSSTVLQTGLRFCLVVAAFHLESQDLDLR